MNFYSDMLDMKHAAIPKAHSTWLSFFVRIMKELPQHIFNKIYYKIHVIIFDYLAINDDVKVVHPILALVPSYKSVIYYLAFEGKEEKEHGYITQEDISNVIDLIFDYAYPEYEQCTPEEKHAIISVQRRTIAINKYENEFKDIIEYAQNTTYEKNVMKEGVITIIN